METPPSVWNWIPWPSRERSDRPLARVPDSLPRNTHRVPKPEPGPEPGGRG
jgi:hypothetical protein